jgi:hypothetical protein
MQQKSPWIPIAATLLLLSIGCSRSTSATQAANVAAAQQFEDAPRSHAGMTATGQFVGFDRNDYPGDATMASMRNTFAFTGYWLNVPPGEDANPWLGKRSILRQQGWGFLVLWNGRLDKEILKAQHAGTSPAALAKSDAAAAIAATQHEGFPPKTILFLDQEEGGALLAEQAAYLLGWTEAIAASGYRPGVYASGQPVPDGPGHTIDTVRDIRARVKKGGLHEIAIFDAQDSCPPAPGCTLAAKPLATSGELDLTAWQYAQSPRRTAITKSCGTTYAADGNCYAPGFPEIFLDMDTATTADPSHGR